MKKVIKNSLVYDGTGNQPYRKNIYIEGDKIAAITEAGDIPAEEVIHGEGLVVTPGFIDTHRHCDVDVLNNPDFGRIELAQGLTTVIGGNCGLAPFPAWESHKKEIFDFIEPCLGVVPKQMEIMCFSDYLKELEKMQLPLHVGSYIATGTLKAAIKGYGKTPFTDCEMDTARNYIREGMEAGAVGLSMGIMYQPECYSSREEMVRLISASSSFKRPLTCHIRGEGDNLVSAVREIIEIARAAEVPLNISHFKATGIRNWGWTIDEAMEVIEKARNRGEDVTVDVYPYCGGSTTLISLIPPTVMEDNLGQTFRKLASGSGKEWLKKELYREHEGWDNMVTSIGWERILLSSVTKEGNRRFTGMDFRQAAALAGYEEPADFMSDLLVEEQGKIGIIVLSMSQEDVDKVMKLPYSMVISDSLYGVGDCPHPRLYGSFPKIIREYVRERRVLSMEEAVRKMTYLPASRLSISERGLIKEGYYADINLFDAGKISDWAVYENPKQLSTGFAGVIIGGDFAVKDDIRTSENYGKIIKL